MLKATLASLAPSIIIFYLNHPKPNILMKYYLLALKNYAAFKGRSNRSEYWYFTLFQFIFVIVAILLDVALGLNFTPVPYGFIYLSYVLATFIPGLSVSVRRLHDLNKSGWWLLIALIPFIGGIWMLVLMASEGTRGDNKYGADPNGTATFDFESQAA
jgi:uncharacterized membrane protein YhaH (DUF805 family)